LTDDSAPDHYDVRSTMQNKKWARLLAYVTGLVNQQLLLQNEYLAAENRILRSHLPARLRLSDPERSTLAEIGKRLGRRGLEQVAGVAQPDTILAWYRRLIARKFDGSKRRSYPGRPPIDGETEALIVRMATENSSWGYDRIVGALANLGYPVSDQTVANGDPARKPGGYHPASHRRVDDANGPQRDGRGMRVSAPTSVRASRPRLEVLHGIPGDAGRGRREVPATSSA
jgi:hypothetical protein